MTKVQIRTVIDEVLAEHKHSKALAEALYSAFESKVSGSEHPPVRDDEGNITEAWCKFHKRYEKAEAMVMSGGKSKGYCKAGISEWNKRMKLAKESQSKVIELLAIGEVEVATTLATEAEGLKSRAADYDSYDYDQDWDNFKGDK